MKRTLKPLVYLLCTLVLAMLLTPLSVAFAAEDDVYISVSYDGKYINGKDGAPIAYVPVSLTDLQSINLDDYELGQYKYDENGDGTYDITALHLLIYSHNNIYGGDFKSEVNITGTPGSLFLENGIFGFDLNLNYFFNGEYPLASAGWGATVDQLVLEPGDFYDLASFSSWNMFMDTGFGFHYFTDADGSFTHSYSVQAGFPLSVQLTRSYSAMGASTSRYPAASHVISYGKTYGEAIGTVTTDETGSAEITFPEAGTYILWADGAVGIDFPDDIVSAPAYAQVVVTEASAPDPSDPEDPDTPDNPDNPDTPDNPEQPDAPQNPQEVSSVLQPTLAQLAATVTEPAFGTTAGEWTVFSLARGNYFDKNDQYFTDYYNRIVETVKTETAKVNKNGALHKNKSTDNARVIVALSAIGKDATSVGGVDLVEAYSANGFSWIKKQGINGSIWALIALDSNNYTTSDPTIRQQCIDSILSLQHNDGGWSLQANKSMASDPDITCMALTALYPYRDQPEVAAACEKAFECMSNLQQADGTYKSFGASSSESCAWIIVATTTWGINPDTDARFIKNGNSVLDGLLAHYLPESHTFEHIKGAGSNAMATDQAAYALVAYDRFINGGTSLYDYSDVDFSEDVPSSEELTAAIDLPDSAAADSEFNSVISINKWDAEAGYKLIDVTVDVPSGISVSGISALSQLTGGSLTYNFDQQTGKLHILYFDSRNTSDLAYSGGQAVAELFSITFKVGAEVSASQLSVALSDMFLKRSFDPTVENATLDVNIDAAKGTVTIESKAPSNPSDDSDDDPKDDPNEGKDSEKKDESDDNQKPLPQDNKQNEANSANTTTKSNAAGNKRQQAAKNSPKTVSTKNSSSSKKSNDKSHELTFTPFVLYQGDDTSIIPSSKKAITLVVKGIKEGAQLSFKDGNDEIIFKYSKELSQKVGYPTYISLVNAEIDPKTLSESKNFVIGDLSKESFSFADINTDGIINAQDALAIVSAWINSDDEFSDDEILMMNVNGDSRINTEDALSIVDAYVNSSEYGAISKSALFSSKK